MAVLRLDATQIGATPAPRANGMEDMDTSKAPQNKESPGPPSTSNQPSRAGMKELLGKCCITSAAPAVNKSTKQQRLKHCGNFLALQEGDFGNASKRTAKNRQPLSLTKERRLKEL